MKRFHMGLAFGLLFACATPPPSAEAASGGVAAVSGATLPPVSFADAETSTNVPFAVGRDGARLGHGAPHGAWPGRLRREPVRLDGAGLARHPDPVTPGRGGIDAGAGRAV